jgi:uncharacterized protein YceH (UPF0502 family)
MDDTTRTDADEAPWTPVRELARGPRRVLGVLLEKAFTTPDQYPLTLKAITSGCNQKSNRDPVVEYSEDQVEEFADQLRELGLCAQVHTDGGRAVRYRHLVRKRFSFSEPQLAILTELWLRGRQQVGELRTRASRMAPIDSQETLRAELQPLVEQGFVQASGSLDRRGVEVDHGFYPAGEARPLGIPEARSIRDVEPTAAPHSGPAAQDDSSHLAARLDELTAQVTSLESRLNDLECRLEAAIG